VHPTAEIRDAAASALGVFTGRYMAEVKEAYVTRVTDRLVELLGGANPAARRGAAAGLAALPTVLLRPRAPAVIEALARLASELEDDPEERDAESRKSAVRALTAICSKESGASLPEDPEASISLVLGTALPALVAAAGDYSTDKRGDVGSWVRESAIEGFAPVLDRAAALLATGGPAGAVAAQAALAWTGDDDAWGALDTAASTTGSTAAPLGRAVGRAAACLLRQAADRIGKLRAIARRHLVAMTTDGGAQRWGAPEPAVHALTCVLAAPTHPDETTPVHALAELLPNPALGDACCLAILEGLVATAGGLDNALADEALNALVASSKRTPGARNTLATLLVRCWKTHARSPRLATPLLRATNALLERAELADAAALPDGDGQPVGLAILGLIRGEVHACRDVGRLVVSVGCFAHLAAAPGASATSEKTRGEVRRGALSALLLLLGSPFPVVRSAVAERLYVATLGWDADELASEGFPATLDDDAVEELQETLVSTPWGVDLMSARAARSPLYPALGIAPPATKAKAVVKGPAADENSSYAALVEDAARGLGG